MVQKSAQKARKWSWGGGGYRRRIHARVIFGGRDLSGGWFSHLGVRASFRV